MAGGDSVPMLQQEAPPSAVAPHGLAPHAPSHQENLSRGRAAPPQSSLPDGRPPAAPRQGRRGHLRTVALPLLRCCGAASGKGGDGRRGSLPALPPGPKPGKGLPWFGFTGVTAWGKGATAATGAAGQNKGWVPSAGPAQRAHGDMEMSVLLRERPSCISHRPSVQREPASPECHQG